LKFGEGQVQKLKAFLEKLKLLASKKLYYRDRDYLHLGIGYSLKIHSHISISHLEKKHSKKLLIKCSDKRCRRFWSRRLTCQCRRAMRPEIFCLFWSKKATFSASKSQEGLTSETLSRISNAVNNSNLPNKTFLHLCNKLVIYFKKNITDFKLKEVLRSSSMLSNYFPSFRLGKDYQLSHQK
jgi:hypothetical protein